MFQMMLLLENLVKSFHARGECLTLVVVQVSERYFVPIGWWLHFINVKVDSVVIRKCHQHGLKTLIFDNHRQILVCFNQLLGKFHSEVRTRDLAKLIQRNIGDTLVNEHWSVRDQGQSFFKRNFNVVVRWFCLSSCCVKGDLLSKLLPVFTVPSHSLIVYVEVLTKEHFYLNIGWSLEPHLEKPSFLV